MKNLSIMVPLMAGLAASGCGGSSGHATSGSAARGDYVATSLVSDGTGAPIQDANLVNPWGIAISPTGGNFWISDNETGKTTLYGGDVKGTALTANSLVVAVPGGSPTGQVFNSTSSFVVSAGGQSAPALFVFASEAGQITGWNPSVPTPAPATTAQAGATVAGAVFKGIALGTSNGSDFLYATDFHNGKVRVFDGGFKEVTPAGSFSDPNLPAGFDPFGIQNVDGTLYVTYAQRESDGDDDVAGAGHGVVDRFDLQGKLLGRFATRGPLNSPWGIAKAPATFGAFAGDILVGNFGDGHIDAYDPTSGKLLGALGNGGKPLVVPFLWGLAFGNGVTAGDANALYFTAGSDHEAHGLFGKITGD